MSFRFIAAQMRMFGNRVLGTIFGHKEDRVARGLEKSNEELHNLCASLNIITVIKSKRVRWVGHVAHMGDRRNACKILVRKLEGRNHSEDLGIDGKKIL